MKRTHRVTIVAVSLVSVTLFFLVLTGLSRKSEGPLARILTDISVLVMDAENAVTDYFRGPGRASRLEWFGPHRKNIDSLRHPPRVLLGAYDGGLPESLDGISGLESTLETTFPLIHLYSAWGDRPDQQFPARVLSAIWNLGSVPVITWEPWLNDFENVNHLHLPLRADRDRGGLAAIARGDYDFYIDEWAAEAADYKHPIFLRFAHEMNDPYRYPWGPHNNPSVADFLEAWRHVHERFKRAGANNILWVWSPHIAYTYYDYYPGDSYVDWVATGVLNYGNVAYWSKWWSFEEIFGKKYIYIAALRKPVMIAEFGSLSYGGDRGQWFNDALHQLPRRHPGIKAILFFHAMGDATVTPQALDWTVVHDSTLSRIIAREIAGWSTESQ
ncbi:MAG: glycosyl hydrolase [Bacteroidota bacterium]